jgi:hypothetical protein
MSKVAPDVGDRPVLARRGDCVGWCLDAGGDMIGDALSDALAASAA